MVALALRDTVQEFAPPNQLGQGLWVTSFERGWYLPPYGEWRRDKMLRDYDRHEDNALWQGAEAGFLNKAANVPWEITGKGIVVVDRGRGPERLDAVNYYTDMLQQAHFGQGWKHQVKRSGRDYLSLDRGAFWEIIGPGDPSEPLTGAVTGIAVLDGLRCFATGNPTYPVIYFSQITGKLHRMHHTRIARFVDMPDGDERVYGNGLCALSRYISIAQQQIYMSRYIVQNLDDKPRPGVNIWSNVSDMNLQAAIAKYNKEIGSDELGPLGKTLNLFNIDPSAPASMTPVNFSNAPEKFDYKSYTEIHINTLALVLGIDKQELWELGGGSLGSGAQSEILAQKARGKAFGDILSTIEQLINIRVLPRADTPAATCDVKFVFKYRDEQEEEAQTKKDQALIQIAKGLKELGFGPKTIANMLADRSETFKELLTDDAGQVMVGTVADDMVAPDRTAASDTPQLPEQSAVPQVPAEVGGKALEDDNRDDRFEFGEYEILEEDDEPPDTNEGGTVEDKKFDPSQPRDGEGQWSETGAGGGGGKKPDKKPSKKPPKDSRYYFDYSGSDETLIGWDFEPSVPKPGPQEAQAVDYYFSNAGAHDINNPLRTGNPLSSEAKTRVKQLDSLLSKSKLHTDVAVYRGIPAHGSRWEQLTSDLQAGRLKPGAVIKDAGFSSTTVDKRIASSKFGGGAVFKIKAPKGSQGLYLNSAMDKYAGGKYRHAYRDEKEVLFARGSKFRVDSISSGPPYEIELSLVGAQPSAIKAYSATKAEFVALLSDLIRGGLSDDMSRRRFGIVMRSHLRRLGQMAYEDGLKAGGVEGEVDDDDLARVQGWLGEQSEYVSSFADSVYKEGLTDDQVSTRADLWANKSLDLMFQEGLKSADANGAYEWTLGAAEEHCETCQRLAGQVHRLKEWHKRDLLPRRDTLACKGFNCRCQLKRTTAPAQGRF